MPQKLGFFSSLKGLSWSVDAGGTEVAQTAG